MLQAYEVREFKTEKREGKLGSFLIGDETGIIRIVPWGNEADKVRNLTVNSIVKIKNGYVKENNGKLEVHLNDNGQLLTDVQNVTINVDPAAQENNLNNSSNVARQATRKDIKDLTDKDVNVEVLATIVQVFDLKFFEVCSTCGKRVRVTDNFTCAQHGIVQPNYSYLINLVIDDGTENMRAVFFREQVEKLLKQTQAAILLMREQPELSDRIKTGLLGSMLKLRGKCTNNQMFGRLEFTVNQVHQDIDPEKELMNIAQKPLPHLPLPKKNENSYEDVPEEIVF